MLEFRWWPLTFKSQVTYYPPKLVQIVPISPIFIIIIIVVVIVSFLLSLLLSQLFCQANGVMKYNLFFTKSVQLAIVFSCLKTGISHLTLLQAKQEIMFH